MAAFHKFRHANHEALMFARLVRARFIPGLRHLAILANISSPIGVLQMGEAQAAARTLGLEVTRLEIVRSQDITPALETLKGRAQALYVVSEALVFTHRTRIHTLATAARLPTMHDYREYVEAGGLMSYGPNFPASFRRAADFVDKILRGASPGQMRVSRAELENKLEAREREFAEALALWKG